MRVRIDLCVQIDPQNQTEIQSAAEQLARGMAPQDLAALWELVRLATRHPAALERARAAAVLDSTGTADPRPRAHPR